jgi:hypothetical protein
MWYIELQVGSPLQNVVFILNTMTTDLSLQVCDADNNECGYFQNGVASVYATGEGPYKTNLSVGTYMVLESTVSEADTMVYSNLGIFQESVSAEDQFCLSTDVTMDVCMTNFNFKSVTYVSDNSEELSNKNLICSTDTSDSCVTRGYSN